MEGQRKYGKVIIGLFDPTEPKCIFGSVRVKNGLLQARVNSEIGPVFFRVRSAGAIRGNGFLNVEFKREQEISIVKPQRFFISTVYLFI